MKKSPEEIYVVYVTYFNTVERLYAFTTLEKAEKKQFTLLKEWVNEDAFAEYCTSLKIQNPTLDNYMDYYIEVEDDSYVGVEKVILEEEE